MPDEIFDIVNEEDEVIGQATRKEVHEKAQLHRAVFVLFIKGDKVLLQRRSKHVESSPGALGATAAGHLESGESYDDAVLRECSEETGWQINKKNLHFLRKLRHMHKDAYGNATHDVFHAAYIYEFEGDVSELVPEEHEVESFIEIPVSRLLNPRTIKEEYSLALSDNSTVEMLKNYFAEKRG